MVTEREGQRRLERGCPVRGCGGDGVIPPHPLSLICVVQNRAYICGHTPAPSPSCGFCWPCKPLSTPPFYFYWWITNKLSQSQNGLCHPCSRGLVRFCYLHANRAPTPPKKTPHHHVNPACIRTHTRTRTLHQPLLPLIQSVVSCVYFILGVYLWCVWASAYI